ncbi:hypothetical protein HK096_003586 [Nowakowskiella sp. JEL0078]|nr:hypothetical protein HK096_003586 [Nowakowskiella sp. JEL0078]
MTTPWQTEYQRQYTWRVSVPRKRFYGFDSSSVVTYDDAVQTVSLVAEAGTQVRPEDLEKIKEEQTNQPKIEQARIRKLDCEKDEPVELTENAKIKSETSTEKHKSQSPLIMKTPNIITYGGGNTNPTSDINYMKSFNVAVPNSQQYPYIQERSQRATPYEEDRKKQSSKLVPNPDALKTYLQASKLVESLQNRFQTEYQREYLNWRDSYSFSHPATATSKRTEQTSPSHPLLNHHSDTTHNIQQTSTRPLSWQKITNDPTKFMSLPTTCNSREQQSAAHERHHFKSAYIADVLDTQQNISEEISERKPVISENFWTHESVAEKDDVLGNGRILQFAVDPPETFHLAQTLLRRSKKRSSVQQHAPMIIG